MFAGKLSGSINVQNEPNEFHFIMRQSFVTLPPPPTSGLAQLVVHRTLGREVPGSSLARGVVCCGLEQVTFPQLKM